MKQHVRHHAKHMVIGGAVVLALLLAAGVTWAEAARWALLLACPVGMVAMMWFMGRHAGRDVTSHDAHGPHCTGSESSPPSRGVATGRGPMADERM